AQAVQAQEQYQRVAQVWDKQAEQLIPELRDDADPEARREVQEGAAKVLRNVGLSDAEVRAAWNGHPIQLRHPAAQAIIDKAAKYDKMMERTSAKELASHRKPPPKLVRPGTAQPAGSADAGRLKQIMRELPTLRGRSDSLNKAVEALALKRELAKR